MNEARTAAATGVAIRKAAAGDFDAVAAIVNWAIDNTAANFRTAHEQVEDWIGSFRRRGGEYPWLVAEQAGEVVGFAMANPFMGRCAYAGAAEVSVYVAPQRQGMGVGRALYAALIPALAELGFRNLIAEIAAPNPASERLHASFGFRRAGALFRVGWKFGRWHDVSWWQLALRSDESPPAASCSAAAAASSPACGCETPAKGAAPHPLGTPDEMLEKARDAIAASGLANAEARKGVIESLPVDSA